MHPDKDGDFCVLGRLGHGDVEIQTFQVRMVRRRFRHRLLDEEHFIVKGRDGTVGRRAMSGGVHGCRVARLDLSLSQTVLESRVLDPKELGDAVAVATLDLADGRVVDRRRSHFCCSVGSFPSQDGEMTKQPDD